jgi:hypothetical protein
MPRFAPIFARQAACLLAWAWPVRVKHSTAVKCLSKPDRALGECPGNTRKPLISLKVELRIF